MVPVPNDLMDTGTESEFAPWDPSKAHILMSTRESCDFFGKIAYLVAGWPGLDKGTLFLVPHV